MRKTFQTKINNRELKVSLGDLSVQADASVLVQYGETVVLVNVCSAPSREGADFFPLTVDYEEKYYAAGEILGSRYLRREGRPSDEAILTSRIIDRAIRPRFPEGFRQDVQVIITVLSFDGENDPAFPALFGASLALSLSHLPWEGPLGITFLAKNQDSWIFNPSYADRKEAKAELDSYRRIKEISPLLEFTEGPDYHSPIISADDMQIEEDRKLITSQTIKTEKKSIYD